MTTRSSFLNARIPSDFDIVYNADFGSVQDTYEDIVDFSGGGILTGFAVVVGSGTMTNVHVKITIDGGTPIEKDFNLIGGLSLTDLIVNTVTTEEIHFLSTSFKISCKVEMKNDGAGPIASEGWAFINKDQ